mmetsp:Transcript_12939/g.18555  ORF Transcript_12939/g.18555 Transcript_12939/m.18555 type:complete len:177 (-) Transcript_12939:471-1001(-)
MDLSLMRCNRFCRLQTQVRFLQPPPKEISKYFVSLERVITRWMKLSIVLKNHLLIVAVALRFFNDDCCCAAAAILVLIRPSRVKSLFTSHQIIFQITVDETSQPHPFFSMTIITLSRWDGSLETSTSARYALYCREDEESIFDTRSFQSVLRVIGDSARPKIQLRAWQGSGEDGAQ